MLGKISLWDCFQKKECFFAAKSQVVLPVINISADHVVLKSDSAIEASIEEITDDNAEFILSGALLNNQEFERKEEILHQQLSHPRS